MSRRAVLRAGMLTSGLMLGAPVLAACGSDSPAAPATTAPAKTAAIGAGTLRLPWLETVEFAGPFIADANGYYKAAGFSSFTLTPGGPTATPVETELVAGKALFGISTPDLAASAVVKGAGLKIIGATFQKNPYAVVSLASKPISTPQDMIGKKIGVAALDESAWTAFLKANHIDPASITTVPVQEDPTPLTTGTVDGWLGYITDQPITLRSKGFPVETFLLADYGYALSGDVYEVAETTITEHRDVVKAFLRSQIMGWQKALADPALGATLAAQKYGKNLGLDVAEQTLTAKAENTLVLTADTKKNGLFTITPELIDANITALKLGGTTVTAGQLFDLSILTEVYQEDPSLV
jgi:ABC-type nitrate/sulfonate/bicarbonate transport system substrate-binding protein